jgi:hypothetical protein
MVVVPLVILTRSNTYTMTIIMMKTGDVVPTISMQHAMISMI